MSGSVFPMCQDCVRAANQIPVARIEEEPQSFSWLCDVCGKAAAVYGSFEAVRGAFMAYTARLKEALMKAAQP